MGSFLPNLSLPFHQDNHCFTVVPLNRSWKRTGREECLLAGMIVLRHNVIIRTQFCRTFGENHFARSLTVCWAVRQLLGDSPPGEQLWSTLWGLNYSFRMATCIQLAWDCGEDFASCRSAWLDGLSAHPASSHFMKCRLFTKVQTLCRHDLVIKQNIVPHSQIWDHDYYWHDRVILYTRCFMICGLLSMSAGCPRFENDCVTRRLWLEMESGFNEN